MRSGSSNTMPSGGDGNAAWLGGVAGQVTQRRSRIACAGANGTGVARPATADVAAGRALSPAAAIRASAPASTARQSLEPRAFITYLAAMPATTSSETITQFRGWPQVEGKWLLSMVNTTGSVR